MMRTKNSTIKILFGMILAASAAFGQSPTGALAAPVATAMEPKGVTAAKSPKGSDAVDDDKRKWLEVTSVTKASETLAGKVKSFRSALEKAVKALADKDVKAKVLENEALAEMRNVLNETNLSVAENRDYVVQIVEYVEGMSNSIPKNRQIRSNDFFRFNMGMKKVSELAKPRIFGNSQVTVVFIVLNVPKLVGIQRVNVKGVEPANDVLKAQREALKIKLDKTFSRLSGTKQDTNEEPALFHTAYAGIKPYLAITKRMPANWSNVLGILSLAGYAAQSAEGTEHFQGRFEYASLFGTKDLSEVPLPCDMDFILGEPDVDSDTTELLVTSGKFKKIGKEFNVLNEGRYYWDASVGLPVTNVRQLEYVSDGRTIQSREISLPNLYALGNFFLPFAKGVVDLEDSKSYWKPRLLFGAGIKGKPFDRLFFGMGMGLGLPGVNERFKFLNEVQLFGGWARTNFTDKPATPAAADQLLPQRTSYRFAFGLNIPVKSAAARLKVAAK
jgi:flagellar motility protein MotE (MotC chaperone)